MGRVQKGWAETSYLRVLTARSLARALQIGFLFSYLRTKGAVREAGDVLHQSSSYLHERPGRKAGTADFSHRCINYHSLVLIYIREFEILDSN